MFSSSKKQFSLLALLLLLSTLFTSIFAAPAYDPSTLLPSRRSTAALAKRYTKFDAENAQTILNWLRSSSGVDSSKLVFYSNPNVGLPMAEALTAANPGYSSFYEIFGESFENAFGFELEDVMDGYDTIYARPMSQAMANFATGQTRVFNHAAATATSFWTTEELPRLQDNSAVTNIYVMDDNTTDLGAHSSDLKD